MSLSRRPGPGDHPVYSISAVARMVNVPVATLRTWEGRYGQVVPIRNASGHRLYTRRQVEQLRYVRAQMSQGASVADAYRLLAEQDETGLPAPSSPPPLAGRPLIQLAESDAYAAELAEHFLSRDGFDVTVTRTEPAARETFAAARPAVVIVDVLISGGVGLALCGYLREQADAPIVVVSAVDAMTAAVEAGADAFLRKPVDPPLLVSTVRGLVRSGAAVAR